MITSILTILGSLFSAVTAWYISKKLLTWVQAYKDGQQRSEAEDLRQKTQQIAQGATEESDRLKKIDGR